MDTGIVADTGAGTSGEMEDGFTGDASREVKNVYTGIVADAGVGASGEMDVGSGAVAWEQALSKRGRRAAAKAAAAAAAAPTSPLVPLVAATSLPLRPPKAVAAAAAALRQPSFEDTSEEGESEDEDVDQLCGLVAVERLERLLG